MNAPLGYLVIMLNGVYDLPSQNSYWALMVNGNYASRGIDYTVLNAGDAIEFLNESYDAVKHANTAVEFRHKIR